MNQPKKKSATGRAVERVQGWMENKILRWVIYSLLFVGLFIGAHVVEAYAKVHDHWLSGRLFLKNLVENGLPFLAGLSDRAYFWTAITLEALAGMIVAWLAIRFARTTFFRHLAEFASGAGGSVLSLVFSWMFFRTVFPVLLIFSIKNPWGLDAVTFWSSHAMPFVKLLLGVFYFVVLGAYWRAAQKGLQTPGSLAVWVVAFASMGGYTIHRTIVPTLENPAWYHHFLDAIAVEWWTFIQLLMSAYIVLGMVMILVRRRVSGLITTDAVEEDQDYGEET